MAILHKATLTPTKAELVAAWLPEQDWYDGVVPPRPRRVATFRLDDPAGEVGLETLLVDTGDERLWQLAFSYRAEPLEGGAEHLVGTLEHSVLGTRYVYDAVGDPVYLEVLRRTVVGAGREADLVRDLGDGTTEPVEKTMTVRGTGGEGVDVVLERLPQPVADGDLEEGSAALVGELPGRAPVVLARLV
ncbi:CG0192-related protein [Actinotalea caeni]|uniref:CG0192-related protein n=1 Tax=Actinotalea caeni TaxID=1348467 RepID=UPI0012E0F8DE|nr:hypothetical protein [Actinotalea caeni]